MTIYHARSRRTRGAQHARLLEDQAKALGIEVAELAEFDELVQREAEDSRYVVVDIPAPARGYALLFPIGSDLVAARMHVLNSLPAAAYRALFSQALVQARSLAGPSASILVDSSVTAAHVLDAVREYGSKFGVAIHVETVADSAIFDEGEASGSEAVEESADGEESGEQSEEGNTPEESENASEIAVESVDEAETDKPEGDSSAEPEPTENASESLNCLDCGKTFKSRAGLVSHVNAKH